MSQISISPVAEAEAKIAECFPQGPSVAAALPIHLLAERSSFQRLFQVVYD